MTEPLPLLTRLRASFARGISRPLSWRKQRLRSLRRALKDREGDICAALHADLGKPPMEVYTSELALLLAELDHILAHVDTWARDEEVPTPLWMQPAVSRVVRQPLGVVLILGPWNYPVQLALLPLAAAVAAGNLAVLKPSELAPATAELLAELLPTVFTPDEVAVALGGVAEATELLSQRWDHVFFTGSERVGRIVMRAAAEHLTPVTLELGGKSPVLVDGTARLGVTARRLLWGKLINSGQTCVAPDYVLVQADRHDALLAELKACCLRFLGADPQRSRDYGRIVSEAHFDRLEGYLDGGTVVHGGQRDRAERFFAPTLLTEVDLDSPVMGEEIFGPVLPVIPVRSLDEAIAFVNARPRPLTLSLFSLSKPNRDRVLAETTSGSACVNQTILNLANPELPFGGVGASGLGAYHGRAGFEAFTHRKGVLERSAFVDPPMAYPPHGKLDQRVVRWLM